LKYFNFTCPLNFCSIDVAPRTPSVKRSRTAFFDLARGQAQLNIWMANGLESLVHMAKLGHACVKQHESLKINIICNKKQLFPAQNPSSLHCVLPYWQLQCSTPNTQALPMSLGPNLPLKFNTDMKLMGSLFQ